MKLSKNEHGALGGKSLVILVVALVVVLAYLSGMITFALPGVASDKYSDTVVRGVTDEGIVVPIDVRITFSQDANTGANKADVSARVEHKHEALGSDGDYVPDATVAELLTWNTDVGNVGDTSTVYGVNGVTFTASDTLFNQTLTSASGANFGFAQKNYKVWLTTGTAYAPVLTADNCALLVQTTWKHYRKATGELLSADTVSWIIYYAMPDYNKNDEYTTSYRYNVFVPFDDYAFIEDIVVDIRGYFENCIIEWTTVSVVTHEWWDWPMFNKLFPNVAGSLFLGRSRDVTLPSAIQYSWIGPTDLSIDNADQYGSHTYTYKIR